MEVEGVGLSKTVLVPAYDKQFGQKNYEHDNIYGCNFKTCFLGVYSTQCLFTSLISVHALKKRWEVLNLSNNYAGYNLTNIKKLTVGS